MSEAVTHIRLNRPASSWQNPLPAWVEHEIEQMPSRVQLGVRAVAQAIANRCDAPNARGDLMYAIGGKSLAADARVSLRTFWRHLDRLVERGIVVVTSRGGQLGDRNIGSTYAIPGQPGGLDDRRVSRRSQVMRLDPDTGSYVPEILEAGEQASLFSEPGRRARLKQRPPHLGTAPASNDACPPAASPQNRSTTSSPQRSNASSKTPAVTRRSCHRDTGGSVMMTHHHSPLYHPLDKNHGASRSDDRRSAPPPPEAPKAPQPQHTQRRRRKAGKSIRHLDLTTLEHTGLLLGKWREEAKRGVVGKAEADRLNFVAAACRALRVTSRGKTGDPCAMFAWLINRGKWALIANQDEQEAIARIKAYEKQLHRPEPEPTPSPPAADPPPKLSADAQAARRTLAVARQRGLMLDPLELHRRAHPNEPWPRQRWQDAVDEIEQQRMAAIESKQRAQTHERSIADE